MTKLAWIGPLAGAVLVLGGCNNDVSDDPASETEIATQSSHETLSATIAGEDDISIFSGAIREADLASVFDGASPYTILAPTDEAFAKLGDGKDLLMREGESAPLIALLRNHIVTGHLRPADIRAALTQAEDGTVDMATVGGGTVTFSLDGDTMTVRGDDGSTARLLLDRVKEASNGVVIPVDTILRRLPGGGEGPTEQSDDQ